MYRSTATSGEVTTEASRPLAHDRRQTREKRDAARSRPRTRSSVRTAARSPSRSAPRSCDHRSDSDTPIAERRRHRTGSAGRTCPCCTIAGIHSFQESTPLPPRSSTRGAGPSAQRGARHVRGRRRCHAACPRTAFLTNAGRGPGTPGASGPAHRQRAGRLGIHHRRDRQAPRRRRRRVSTSSV